MNKTLALLGLLVVSFFLIGCSTEKTVEIVDEEGNIVGEAFNYAPQKYKITVDKTSPFVNAKKFLELYDSYCLPGYLKIDPYYVKDYTALMSTLKYDSEEVYFCLGSNEKNKVDPYEFENKYPDLSACGSWGYLIDKGLVDINVNSFKGKAYVCYFEP